MNVHEWWANVSDLDRRLLLTGCDRLLLPADVIPGCDACGGPPLEPVDGRPGRYRWPANVRVFLLEQASIDPDCE
jgi:hypothetical protein